MDGSLILLILATAAFVGLHLGLSLPAIRGALVARLGANAFRGAYSVQSLVTLVLVVLAYNRSAYHPLWVEPALSWAPILVVPVALWLVIGALTTRNPTLAAPSGESAPDPRRNLPLYTAVTRHPMLWGILLWALAHIAANGDLASLVLFGGMGLLALAGMWGIDAKKRADPEFDFESLSARTSLIPFAATLSGRNRLAPTWGDLVRLVAGVVLFVGLLHLHLWLFGASPYPL